MKIKKEKTTSIKTAYSFPRAPARIRQYENALKCWNKVVPILFESKAVKPQDCYVIEALCMCWHRYCDADVKIDTVSYVQTSKTGYENINPYVVTAEKYLSQFVKLSSELGLTPKSRSQIKEKNEVNEDEELASMLG